MAASLDIVIVNWNSGQYLRRCLSSIPSAVDHELEIRSVVVVDNASSDDSAEDLNCSSLRLRMIVNTRNEGFSAACNRGAAGSTGDYLLFLNPDIVLLPDSLSKAVCFMEDHNNATVGICGIQLIDENSRITRSCSHFPKPAGLCARMLGLDRLFPRIIEPHFLPDSEHHASQLVDQVMGAFTLVRRKLFESLNGFDERFFVYYEDLDFALRCKQSGYVSYYLADAQAMHTGAGCSRHASAAALVYNLTSRVQYSWKHFSVTGGVAVLLGTLLVEPLARLARAVLRGSSDDITRTLQAYMSLWRQTLRLFSSQT